MAKWTGSITENMIFNLELYFLKGLIDNYIARSKFNKDYAFVYDTTKIKTQQDALDSIDFLRYLLLLLKYSYKI